MEKERDSLLRELEQQATEIRGVEEDLGRIENEKASVLESFNGMFKKNGIFLSYIYAMYRVDQKKFNDF